MTTGTEKEAGMTMMAAIQVGSVFIEFSRFLPSGSQARWRVERIVALPNLPEHVAIRKLEQIGRESCRERVCKYVEISVVAVALKKKKRKEKLDNDNRNNRIQTLKHTK